MKIWAIVAYTGGSLTLQLSWVLQLDPSGICELHQITGFESPPVLGVRKAVASVMLVLETVPSQV